MPRLVLPHRRRARADFSTMRILATALATALAMPLAAQNCFWGDFGSSLGYGTTDTVYAIRPIGFAFPFAGASYTDIHVNDHGFVQLSNGGVPAPLTTNSPALYTPTVANFVAGGPKIAPLYSDMTLAGGGECWIRSTPTQCTVTWHNVQSYGIPSPRFSFQLVLRPNGDVQFLYGPGCTNNSTFGGVSANAVVGITNGVGPAPASRDLSAGGGSFSSTTHEEFVGANTFDLANNTLGFTGGVFGSVLFSTAGAPANCATTTRYGAGCDGLGLGAVGLPAIGNASFQLRAEAVPAVSPLAFFAFGTVAQNPGLPLGPLLGMTGCSGHTNADLGIFGGSPAAAGPTGITPVSSYGLAIPVSAPLIGTTFATQALALSLANPFGLASSNGLELRLGIDGSRIQPNPQWNMVAIAPGTFQMGQVGVAEPVHQVTLSAPFWMGKYEVTQAQYQSVMGSNPSFFQGASAPNAPQRPVELVSWNDAVAYCQRLTASEQVAGRVPAGYQYRLPTEAEWEYCCRAGTTTAWHTGASLSTSQANFQGALANATHPDGQTAVVGSYAPNAFGLHDMHGNVEEWCLDSSAPYAPGPVTNPFVTGGTFRIIRSGCWDSAFTASLCRSASRSGPLPTIANDIIGFRVVLAPVLVP